MDDPGNAEFWEVDPHWDGRVFRSAAQALRPSSAAPLPMEIGIKTGRDLCVRVLTASGELQQQQLDVQPVSDPPDRL